MTIASLGAYCSCVDFALLRIKDIAAIYSQTAHAPETNVGPTDWKAAYQACRLIFTMLRANLEDMLEDEPGQWCEVGTLDESTAIAKAPGVDDVSYQLDVLSTALEALFASLQT